MWLGGKMSISEKKTFLNKVVLITGASSGIGLATAKAFAAEGATLMLAARDPSQLIEAALVCRGLGVRCEVVPTDIQNYSQVKTLIETTIKLFGSIDVLVNNAGVGTLGLFHQQKWDEINQTLLTNQQGTLAVTHAALPHMIAQASGTIVNVSSVIGKRAIPGLAAYCATKFALWGFSDSLRLELQPYGIQVCHFCPTTTDTEFQRKAGIKISGRADSAEKVAQALMNAVRQKKAEYIMSFTERILIKALLIAPGFVRKFYEKK